MADRGNRIEIRHGLTYPVIVLSDPKRLATKLSLVALVFTCLAIVMGGIVRATDSGEGCPRWPKCYGRWIPPADHHAIIEMSHRYLVSISIWSTVAVALVVVLKLRKDRIALWVSVGLLPLFVAQALLGAYVVHSGLQAWTVVAHLGLGMLTVAVVGFLLFHLDDRVVAGFGSGKKLLIVAAVGVFCLSLLGSYVTGRDAGLAFRDWPLMDGKLLPKIGDIGPQLQFFHRLVAAAVGGFVIWLMIRFRVGQGETRKLAHGVLGMFVLEILVGATNVFSRLHSVSVSAHLALSVGIWLGLVLMILSVGGSAIPVGRSTTSDQQGG